MRISQLAERSGVAASTLRYYEERGLLPARRSAAGYRLFGEGAVERLAFITTAKRLGLDLAEIAELLEVWQNGACAQVKASLRPRIDERLARTLARGAELEGFARLLRGALAHLDALPDRQGRCDSECEFLDLGDGGDLVAASPELPPSAGGAPPVACSLDAADMDERIGRWRLLLHGARREEIPGGLRLSLPAGRAADAAGLAAAEQECCGFFTFTLHLQDGRVLLDVRAPDGARDLLTEVFGAKEDRRAPEGSRPC
ncbi:MerR family transcriptional regulator [Nocardiopsis suaedae]|uniref:MerR family transcriptional regulator n=1 Tax=Nocardiopsis suaedae TaxID=3018444 RepID=A0ABT4TN20_9ACTN|nr:MerR family transcriptional regulator [Nocardiopsis suaedae]MDA2806088.1 MerR family transcriptional regulator [Nocardiopsis suaedae]